MAQGSEPLRRAVAVMDLVASSTGLTIREISSALDLPLPTAHRLVSSLTDIGYLSGGGRGSSYRLGPRFYRQFHYSLHPQTLASVAAPMLQPLAEELQETVFMACLKGEKISLGAAVLPNQSVRTLIHPGHLFPVHASSAGKVICAHQSRQFIERALNQPLEAFRPNTTTNSRILLEQYELVRQQGYASIDDELDEGVYAVSCPVRIRDEVLYSVGIVGIRERMLKRSPVTVMVARLQDTANELGPLVCAIAPPSEVRGYD